jgi:hypothetical protein
MRACLILLVFVWILSAACMPQAPAPTAQPTDAPAAAVPTSAPAPTAPPANAQLPATPVITATLLPKVPTVMPAAAGQAPIMDWQTYNNKAGFSIRYPPTWTLTTMPDDNSGQMHGVEIKGHEGDVVLQWGMGFGGACGQYSPIHVAQGQLTTCHTTNPDGTDFWNQIYAQLADNVAFGARVTTSNTAPASRELVLNILATLTFTPPPPPLVSPTPAPGTPAPPPGEIIVDNRAPAFWPHGAWFFLTGGQPYGPDCLKAPRGLYNVAQVRPILPAAGPYEIFAWFCGDPNHELANRSVIEVHRDGSVAASQAVTVNYQEGRGWQSLGTYQLQPGAYLDVRSGLNGNVTADAYRFVPRGEASQSEILPTPMPTPVIDSHNPPSPLAQLTSGDLVARLGRVDPFYTSVPVSSTEQTTFDDCQAFPRDGCGGMRDGWRVQVRLADQVITYLVSSDYQFVAPQGLDQTISPWLMGQDQGQTLFLTKGGTSSSFAVYLYPGASTWRLLSLPGVPGTHFDGPLTADQITTLRGLIDKYATVRMPTADNGGLTLLGLGTQVALTAADQQTLAALGNALAQSTK